MFGDEQSVVEATGADVFGAGGQRNNDDSAANFGQGGIEQFGQRTGESASGMIF